jgi:MFS transporter, PAT family, beta-lactamase induction signal transducer AmpG
VERTVQGIAGKASIFAMLNILTILIVDAWALGALRGLDGSAETSFLGVAIATEKMRIFALAILGLSFAFKMQFSLKTYSLSHHAHAVAAPSGEKAYAGNARGAWITTLICGVTSALVLFIAFQLAF